MQNKTDPIERTAVDFAAYASLHLDKLRLRLLDNFATFINTIFGILLLIILLSFAVFFLAAALVWVLSVLIGSLWIACLIVAGIFLVAALIVWINRRKLIVNPAVRMLSRIMFERDSNNRNDLEDDDYE